MSETIEKIIQFEVEHCCNCGIPFAMSKDFRDKKLKGGSAFYCPKGHRQFYTISDDQRHKNEIKKLKDKLAKAKDSEDWAWECESESGERLAQTKKEHANTKRQKTRMLNKIKKGECPCCNQKFENIHKHIKEKHPEF